MTLDLPLDPPRLGTLAIALVLLALGAMQISRALQAEATERTVVTAPGPIDVDGQTLALVERPGPAPHTPYVDIVAGDQLIAGQEPVWVDMTADPDDYAQRYAGRFTLFEPRTPEETGWQLLEILHEFSDVSIVVFRLVEIEPDGNVENELGMMRAPYASGQLTKMTLGTAPAPKFVFPAPLLLLVAAWLALRSLVRPLPAAWPTVLLTGAMAALASLVAWPPMLQLGLARTLAPPVLALGVALLVALAAGPKAQALATRGGPVRAAWVGAAVGVALLGLFVLVQVNVGAFVAPVFRPPGGPLSPAQWLVRDFVAPATLLGATGLPLAVVAGACYGLLCRAASKGSVRQ